MKSFTAVFMDNDLNGIGKDVIGKSKSDCLKTAKNIAKQNDWRFVELREK